MKIYTKVIVNDTINQPIKLLKGIPKIKEPQPPSHIHTIALELEYFYTGIGV